MRSELAVPVHAGSELWGAIDLQSAERDAFDEDDARLVELVADHVGAALRTAELYRKLEQTHLGVAEALAAALEAKDGYTADHARWIADLAVEVGRELELDEAVCATCATARSSTTSARSRSRRDPEQARPADRRGVRGHQAATRRSASRSSRRSRSWPRSGASCATTTSAGTAPATRTACAARRSRIGARIVLVVDAYHAMISDRPYRKAMAEEEARERLAGGRRQPVRPRRRGGVPAGAGSRGATDLET